MGGQCISLPARLHAMRLLPMPLSSPLSPPLPSSLPSLHFLPALAARMIRDELAARVGTEMDALAQVAQADDEDGDDDDDGSDGGGGVAVDGMSYDQLLALSDRIGDVAKERWALVSAQFVATLPAFSHCAPAAGSEGQVGGSELPHPPSSSANAMGESLDRCVLQSVV